MFANKLVTSLLLSLLLATTGGSSSSSGSSGVSVTATEVLQVGATASSVVSLVEEEDVEDGNNEDGLILEGGFEMEEPQPQEQEPAPLSTSIRRTLRAKNSKSSTAEYGCNFTGRPCSTQLCCVGLICGRFRKNICG